MGLQGALERIGTIQAGGAGGAGVIFARRFDAVMQARNGVAHIGDQGGGADEVAQLAVRGADEILSMMGEDLHEVFGDYTDAAVSLLDEASTAVEQVITLRLGHARQVFATRVSDFTEAEREEELAALDRLTMLQAEEDDRKVALGCPACERIGFLTGSPYLEMQPGEHFVDADGSDKVLVAIRIRLSADGFRCPVCSLRLHGPEQLREVPLPTQALVRIGTHEDLATFGEQVRIIENDDSANEDE